MKVLPALALLLLFCSCGGGSDPAPAVPPTGLAAQVRATSLTLTWTDATFGETGYAIERAQIGKVFARIATLALDATSYVDTGLVPSTNYSYRVQALFASGLEIASAVFDVKTSSPTATQLLPASSFAVGGQRITIRGDGFSHGVDRVLFNQVEARDVVVVDDTTLACTTPASKQAGLATVAIETKSITLSLADAFQFFPWPPRYQQPTALVRGAATSTPDDVQLIANDWTSNLVWVEDSPFRALFASHFRSGTWEKPVRLNGENDRPRQPHATIDGANVFVVWTSFGKLYIVKSTDFGKTWSEQKTIDAAFGGVFSPKIFAQGRSIQIVWFDPRTSGREIYHTSSTDGGATFGRYVRVNTGPFGTDRLALTGSGTDVYLLFQNAEGTWFNRSTDHGATWTERDQKLALGNTVASDSPPQIVAANGTIHVLTQDNFGREIGFQRSTDRGATWSKRQRLDRSDDPSSHPQIAVTPRGDEVYIVWQEGEASKVSRIELNRSVDGGKTFLPFAARVADAGNPLDPVVCCNGQVVTVAFLSGHATSPQVYATSSDDFGLRWQAPMKLNLLPGTKPRIHCRGGDVTAVWVESDSLKQTADLRATATLPR